MKVLSNTALAVDNANNASLSLCHADGLRRALITELREIETCIISASENDQLAEDLALWHREFRNALNTNEDVKPIFDQFAALLQRILVDSLSNTPLEKDSFLGSDGNCYTHKTLCLFESSLPESHWFRSPFDLENPEQDVFFVVPHDLARHMLTWLEKRVTPAKDIPRIEEPYEQLVLQLGGKNVNRLVPTVRNNRLRSMQKEQRLRDNHQAVTHEMQISLVRLERDVRTEIENEFGELALKVDQATDCLLERLAAVESTQNTAYREISKKLTLVESDQDSLRIDIKKLEHEITYINSEVDRAKKDQLEVQLSIKKVEAAIEKRKQERKSNLVGTIAVVGVCVLGTILLESGAILPALQGNGLSLIVAI